MISTFFWIFLVSAFVFAIALCVFMDNGSSLAGAITIICFISCVGSVGGVFYSEHPTDTKNVTYNLSEKVVFDESKPFTSMNMKKNKRYHEIEFKKYDKDIISEETIEYHSTTKFQYQKSKSNKMVVTYWVNVFGEKLYPKTINICYK